MLGPFLALAVWTSASPAWALEPYMYGVGPSLGTVAVPARYPVLPKVVAEDGDIERVGADALLGLQGQYYANKNGRVGGALRLDAGKGLTDYSFMVSYDYVKPSPAMDFVIGGSAGAGVLRLKGDGEALLKSPYYPFRVDVGAQIRNKNQAYQATLFGAYELAASTSYTNKAGEDVDAHTGFYAQIGAEVGVWFGDFTPPKKKKGHGHGGHGGKRGANP